MNTCRIRAASRLHFGLLSLSGSDPSMWLPLQARYFGGVGLMVERPGIELAVSPAPTWSAAGPGAHRTLHFGRSFCQFIGQTQAFHINIHCCPPEHVGLGTGTQLGLAVARALALATHHEDTTSHKLAEILGRGKRSALGIHGFAQGGFLVDGGKNFGIRVAPLACHSPFPDDWSVLLITPQGLRGTHGDPEQDVFAALSSRDEGLRHTEILCRLVLLGILPALAERDVDEFGEALHEFNYRVGELFHPWQGGVYADPKVAALIRFLRQRGVRGVGQSSWGPTVFAIVDGKDQAGREWDAHLEALKNEFGLGHDEIIVTRAANHGAMHELVA